MNKYQCQVCGAVSYSAASQENLKDNSCLECDGRVEMVDGDKMNADEIVRELGHRADAANKRGYSGEASEWLELADLIESLQAQLEQKTNEAEGMRSNWYKCIENLKESQRRADAAVEDLYRIAACDACKHYDPDENACAKPMVESYKCFEWRGPDEKGETHE